MLDPDFSPGERKFSEGFWTATIIWALVLAVLTY